MPGGQPSPLVRFGYIGQISPHKGVDVLISAFLMQGIQGRARLDIHGDETQFPDYTQQILAKLRTVCENAVTLHGKFPPSRLGEVLSDIDVLVVPSTWRENNPRVVQEAFAARVPIIGSDVAGISEFVQHGVSGLLFERGSASDLARQMRRIITEPRLLETLRAGIPPVKTIEQEMDQLMAVYEGVQTGG
jgi:glycosyltransferase involved in cell wall biosynthesis